MTVPTLPNVPVPVAPVVLAVEVQSGQHLIEQNGIAVDIAGIDAFIRVVCFVARGIRRTGSRTGVHQRLKQFRIVINVGQVQVHAAIQSPAQRSGVPQIHREGPVDLTRHRQRQILRVGSLVVRIVDSRDVLGSRSERDDAAGTDCRPNGNKARQIRKR